MPSSPASRSPRRRHRLLATVAAGALALAACGGDDDGNGGDGDNGDADAYAEVLAAEFRADPENPFSDEEADCVARRFVDIVGGPQAFRDAGVSPDDLAESDAPLGGTDLEFTDEQARQFGASFSDCGINFVDLFVEGMGDVSDEAMDCLREQMTDDVVGQMFVLLNQDEDDDALDAVVFDAIGPCMALLAG